MPASPGTVSGAIAFSPARAGEVARDMPVILVRRELATDDFAGLSHAAGMLTAVGSRTSHAAVVARQLDKPCVVGCAALQIDEPAHACDIGGHRLCEGEWLTVDGDTGRVYAGAVPVITERPTALLDAVRGWTAALTD
jgi:pyruvate,orthophosphate dikinase